MTDHKKFKNESQDARRHDQQNATHPTETIHNTPQDKSAQKQTKDTHTQPQKRK